ncbi:Rv2175c family DNA-binding protein [Corynebacterium mendelii]
MSSHLDPATLIGPDEPMLPLEKAADMMGVPASKIVHLVRDGKLIALRSAEGRVIPGRYLDDDGRLNRFVPGITALLKDGGYSDEEIIRHLFDNDDTLPGRPIDCLHGHLAREVMRRAQAMAL